MRKTNKLVALLVVATMLMLPATVNAQTDWVARNIYAFNQNIGYGMSIDYNTTTNELRVLLVNNGMATENIGLAILEVVFGVKSIPNKIDAYLVIDNETVPKYQNQLINWSISPVTWTFPNETEVPAYYAYAYIYLFENKSITNETTQRPWFEENVFNAELFTQDDSKYALSENNYIVASEENPVYVDYSFEGIATPEILVIGGVVVVAVVAVVAIVWYKRR